MGGRWTTRCCSAIALIAVAARITSAETKPSEPLGLFPVKPIWNLSLGSVLPAVPVLKDRRGYFPVGGERLAAYDIENGTLLWLVPARPRFQPALGDGLVFLVEPEGLVALHDDTGAVAWRVPIDEELAAPLVWDNAWLIGTTKAGDVLAFRGIDGGMIWRQSAGGTIRGAAAIARDKIYVPLDDGRIVALSLNAGDRAWERRLGGAPNEILALDDRVFVGSNDNYFYAISARNGEVLWRWSTGADVVGLPAADANRVYFVSFDNVLRGLDQKSGAQRWKRALPLRPTRGPLLVGDVLIASGIAATSPAYHTKDGTPAGEISAAGELMATPHVVPGPVLPQVVLVTREVADDTIIRALARSVEPAVLVLAPLPNPLGPPPLPYPDLTFETCVNPEIGEEYSPPPPPLPSPPPAPSGPSAPSTTSAATSSVQNAAGTPRQGGAAAPPPAISVNRTVRCVPEPDALGTPTPVEWINWLTPDEPPKP